jgi:DNA-binding IclR family transcriptional regulator
MRMARTGQASRGRVASSGRSVAILDVLADAGALGTNEIARRTGMSASTASRQLGTLLEGGLIEFVEETGGYRLGLRLVRLGNAVLARLDVRNVARVHLQALVAAVGETATLSVPGAHDAITVDFVPTQHYVQGVTQLGRPSVGHATAAGKIVLAFAGRTPPTPLTAYTRRTITDPAVLETELARVRERGWAGAYEERELELNAIAAPIWNSLHELEAIVAVQGPIPRFGHKPAARAVPALVEQAGAISRALGYADSTSSSA